VAHTLPLLRRQLSVIEPDETMYAGIGPDDVEILRRLLDDTEAWIAARAAYALARIRSDDAEAAFVDAAAHTRPEVRVAVATSASQIRSEVSDQVLSILLRDDEAGVRKFAIASVSRNSGAGVRADLQRISSTDDDARLRRLADEKLSGS
jgi:HEAT repeat protein